MMKLSMTGQMRMEQKMKLAPRMIQSMEVLQLPMLALQEKIEAELNSNPVLEIAENREESAEASSDEFSEVSQERELVVREDSDYIDDFQRLENIKDVYGDYIGNDESFSYRVSRLSASSGEEDKKMEALQNTAAQQLSLHDYLKEQWRMVEADTEIKAAGDMIIDYIDEKGYLSVHLEQLHNKDKNGFGMEHLQKALELIQKLEPAGVGARDLRECLLIQMRQFPDDMSLEMRVVQECWEELLENHLPLIAKKLNCSLEQVNRAIERMSKLDTSPGLLVGRNENHPISADIIVEPDEHDGYTVRLVETKLPNLRVSEFYQKMAHDRRIDEQTRQFLQKNIRSAQWFMDAIRQRKHTLLRVANAIVKHQKDFFDKGKLYLRPLPMAAIAQEVGVHIATVSRAVSGKYMQCPQGILPLRSFFSGGMEDACGQEHSWDAVKAKLQEIVDKEDKSNPLSDDEIREKLMAEGMGNIARRTVAKYRKLLNIPTARLRKKY
ncbi:MAG TPA: RNA polymerase factor sigma-54 [Anaerohalosphaeraceae bacterium]|nr:RNA polymerase factor sigma-54 [Anaerohalosphaeraceae bacterium]HOL32401.1 RNA polymerase factor sigma-54 [Anaerohalosphaeraceae bacterium]HOM76137.1 RNA polymerase factor sigma-54 [Anaerohalosphaeraceae bacterium]HPC63197.1 RNA polymerase factor sigma-54 [Anaerohalosphaeraceae bacterium]HPO70053.1 RNA polymerase factor sigma-54 [Anaerohalosphaeraceae bacterium]